MSLETRHAQPSDYGRVIQHVNAWWGGREMAPMLPKLFFLHFEGTSFVAEDEEGKLVAFLIGFLSQSDPDEAYIHFVGVAPEYRGSGIGRELYERFFSVVAAQGRSLVRCVTSPVNEGSVAFHESLGFTVNAWRRTTTGPARIACSSSSTSVSRAGGVARGARVPSSGCRVPSSRPRSRTAAGRDAGARRGGARQPDRARERPRSARSPCWSAERFPAGRRSAASTVGRDDP